MVVDGGGHVTAKSGTVVGGMSLLIISDRGALITGKLMKIQVKSLLYRLQELNGKRFDIDDPP